MYRETLRSRDHLLHHLKTVHEQKDLTHVKRHANNCKTYNLPVIPRPNRGRATKVEMVKKVDEVKEGIKVKKEEKEEKEEGMVVNSGLPIFHRYFNALDPLCLLKFFICNFRKPVSLPGPMSVDQAIAITRAFKSTALPLQVVIANLSD